MLYAKMQPVIINNFKMKGKKTMERKIQANKTNSYTTIQDYFLAHWVNTIGIGPAMLYIQLLSYCHKGKDTAWPSQ